MKQPLKISGRLLARNTILNFIGQALPLLVGVVTIPFIIRGLGAERFGLLSMAWVVLGFSTVFDLGLGRATTKYVAEALGKGEENQVPSLVWTAVAIQAVFGLIGAITLVIITPLLVEQILNIPPSLVEEAKGTFYWLALGIPVVLISSSFSGVLEAAQRFDLANLVRVPLNVLTFLLPAVGVIWGFSVFGIIGMILVARFAALAAFVGFDFYIFPCLKTFSARSGLFPRLFAYGGWVTVTNIVGPVLLYFDRFLIASVLSMAAVAYYVAPYEVMTRLLIIPASLTLTLFPAFSAMEGMRDQKGCEILFARSVKYVLLAMGAVVFVTILFTEDILYAWLGSDFAARSKTVMGILALGVLINALAYIPCALLHGIERPDIQAKFHLLELPLYVGMAWVFVGYWGIAGAAAAWTVRVMFDALLLFVAAFKVCRLSPRLLADHGLTLTSLGLLLFFCVAYGLKSLMSAHSLFTQSLIFIALCGVFAWFVWKNLLNISDRRAVLNGFKGWSASEGVS